MTKNQHVLESFVIFHKVFQAIAENFLHHVLLRIEAERQNFCQCSGLKPFRINHVNQEIIITEFPHNLAADPAGRERAGDDTVLTTADSNGQKITVTVINRLEKSSTFRTVGGTVGSIFNVADTCSASACHN